MRKLGKTTRNGNFEKKLEFFTGEKLKIAKWIEFGINSEKKKDKIGVMLDVVASGSKANSSKSNRET